MLVSNHAYFTGTRGRASVMVGRAGEHDKAQAEEELSCREEELQSEKALITALTSLLDVFECASKHDDTIPPPLPGYCYEHACQWLPFQAVDPKGSQPRGRPHWTPYLIVGQFSSTR